MVLILFWISFAALFYIYLGYPLAVRLWSAVAPRPIRRDPTVLSSVAVIITAYNEEKSIRAKIDNVLALDYPANLLDVVVVSDASTDSTDKIVGSYPSDRTRLLRIEGRRGKTECQNIAAESVTSEIIVFTDATTKIESGALRALMENFADADVGCVAGALAYEGKGDNLTAAGGVSYWGYEFKLRNAESRCGTLIGVSGCFYGVRKRAYRPIHGSLISDFVIAMRMREQGLRTILETRAICVEETLDRSREDLSMRVRVAVRSIAALVSEKRFLNPLNDPRFAWQLWSHKLLRYTSPYWLLLMLATCGVLARNQHGFRFLLAAQLFVIGAGVAGFAAHLGSKPIKVLNKPYYFLLTNVASIIAIIRYIRGDRIVIWNPIR